MRFLGAQLLHLVSAFAGFTVFFVLIVVNCIQMLTVPLLLVSPAAFRAANRRCAAFYWGFCDFAARHFYRVEYDWSEDSIPVGENAIVVSNHQSFSDVLALFRLGLSKRRLGYMKYFAKAELKWVPGIGWGSQFMGFLFVQRNWEVDRIAAAKVFAAQKRSTEPFWVVLFPEGTRRTPDKLAKSQEYARKNNLVEPHHVLLPRPRGFAEAVQALRHRLDAVYDVSIAYPGGSAPALWKSLQGALPRLKVRVRRFPVASLPATTEELSQWLRKTWYEKDQWLAEQKKLEGTMGAKVRTVSVVAALTLLFAHSIAEACTIFQLPGSKGCVVGRNYDWHQDPALLLVNPKDVKKVAFHPDKRLTGDDWTALYGSLTVNQYGREMPIGGVNEEGLVVEALWLNETTYPPLGSGKITTELQWIQRQLDMSKNVPEFLANAEKFGLAKVYGDLHFFACDSDGRCGIVEFLKNKKGEGEVRKRQFDAKAGEPFAVTNSTWEESAKYLSKFDGFGGALRPAPDASSLGRFLFAGLGMRQWKEKPTDDAPAFALEVLKTAAAKEGGQRSVFSYAYDREAKTILMSTLQEPKPRVIRYGKMSFACKDGARMLPIHTLPKEGQVIEADQFVPYTKKANAELIRGTFGHIENVLPEGTLERFAEYPDSLKCR